MTFETKESFADLLDSALGQNPSLEGRVVSGVVVAVSGDMAIIDVGFKSEGRVLIKEIVGRDAEMEVRVGDVIDVFIERLEDKNGEVVLSVEKARREAVWRKLPAVNINISILRKFCKRVV
jgi:small subunit ribosomal protein S1